MEPSNWIKALEHAFNRAETQLTLFQDNDEIHLQRHEHGWLLRVQLTHEPASSSTLQMWLRLGQASLEHFQGALALAPFSGHLWLLERIPKSVDQTPLLASLEALLNQRDRWRAVATRIAKPVWKSKTNSLRPPLY
ncbi:CesT family type III secretion system chaperone [Pseudomonas cedrina subsp. fulgida]|nr:CesT family type III secretion system chaperone [Pseudomonas cedrina subsp. fulgida]